MKAQEIITKIKDSKASVEFMKTGLSRLDNFLDGGLLRKELIVIGGYTGSGKSFMAAQIMFSIAKQGFKTGYFSLEISNEMILSRLIGQNGNIKPARVLSGYLTETEHESRRNSEAQIIVYDGLMSFHDDLYQLEEIKQAIRVNEYEFVVVDFIQNVMSKGYEEYERLSYVALELQKLAKETNCCIMVISQLSNSAAKSLDGQVEYKGSGSIATVADLGFYIVRKDTPDDAPWGQAELHIKKNRRGYSGNKLDLRVTYPGGMYVEEPQISIN